MKKQQNKKPRTALVTGATGGIGRELCHRFARDQINLVLVARNAQKLKQLSEHLQNEFAIKIDVYALDLAVPDAARKLYQQLQDHGLQIDFLVNNAGVGYYGPFFDSDPVAITNMLDLNITTLVQLTRLVLPDMLRRNCGRILQVASLVAFQPGGPNAAVYYASKNFVLTFNRALAVELKHSRVTSTTFCPGPLTTSFAEQGGFATTRLYRYFSGDIHKQVAKAYLGLMKGKSTVVPGWVNKLLAFSGELPPRGIALAVNKFLLT